MHVRATIVAVEKQYHNMHCI